MPSGMITKGIGGFYYVATKDGLYECKARGVFRKDEITPLPGDNVIISVIDEKSKRGYIEKILDRTTVLMRPAVANVEQLVAVIATKSPEPDLMLLDKLLITAENSNMQTVICINKIDLDPENKRKSIFDDYVKAGYSVIETSSTQNEGFGELKAALKGRISVFAGQSGVGKSTILNRIMDTMVMETGSLSDKIERGKHTTRHAQLVELKEGGYIVDTPGFSSFELMKLEYPKLQYFYHEFEDFTEACKFRGCSHVGETECGVKQAVECGDISKDRYYRYVELYTVLKQQDSLKYKKR